MADTTYDILNKKVADLQKAYDAVSAELIALKTDANYLQLRSQLDSLYANRTSSASASISYANADNIVRTQNEKIRSKENEQTDLKLKLADAVGVIAAYEKNSPTVKGELAAKALAAAGSSSRKTLIVIALVLVVVTISVIAIIKTRNKNKPKT